jgi:proteasome lid subunit RPN8/RPN11
MIRIPTELLRRMHAHAERDYPHECCGALLGSVQTPELGDKEVAGVSEVPNRREADAAHRRFLITPDDYRAIERAAHARSLEVLGFYHSHPDHPALPSDYDRAHALPWYSYVIISVRAGRAQDATAWVLGDDRGAFNPEPIVEIGAVKPQPGAGTEREGVRTRDPRE